MKLKRKGFTLIELVVGLGLVSIFALAAVSFLASQLRVNATQTAISHAQTSMEATMNLIRWDVMMAGFGSPRSITPVSGENPDPTRPDPDQLVIETYYSPVGGNGHWSYLVQDANGLTNIFVRRWTDNVFTNLAVGDTVIVFNINKIKLGEARVQGSSVVNSNTLRLTLSAPITAMRGSLIFSLPQDGRTEITYQVVNGALFRNNTMLQDNVEDFQVEYWIDSNNDGVDTPDEWRPTFTQNDLSNLKLIRVTVVKLVGPDSHYDEGGRNYSIADDTYTVPNFTRHFRRKIYEVTVKPRNMGV